jgi:hypothetical protein
MAWHEDAPGLGEHNRQASEPRGTEPSNKHLLANAMPRRIPLLPPCLSDETFGSWLRRCAVSHRQRNVWEFAESILASEGEPAPARDIDWDCAPPEALVHILSERGRIPIHDLQGLITHKTKDTLRPSERDAYCPICFQSDVARRAIYRRRQWLDAWTMTCSVHGVLLWSYEPVARAKAPGEQMRALLETEQIRLGTTTLGYVTGFSPPEACWSPLRGLSRRERDLRLAEGHWLDRELLTTQVGRSLVLLCGSRKAESVYYVLFGSARRDPFCWSDDLSASLEAPLVASPMAAIRVRLTATYTAAAIWRLLDPCQRHGSDVFTEVDQVLSLCKVGKWTDTWPPL